MTPMAVKKRPVDHDVGTSDPGSGTALLEVRGLTVEVDAPAGRLTLLDDVDLSIERGQSVGLIGETGSGKTLTARAVIGLLPPTMSRSGRISWQGTDLLAVPAARTRALRGREISMIFQDPMSSFNPSQRIGRQIGEVLRRAGVGRQEVQARTVEMMDRVGIPDPTRRARSYPHQLSGGLRQRAMIAMAMIAGPSLILADEPTTALDVTVQARVLQVLRTMREQDGAAMLFVSHDLRVVSHVTDAVLVMYAGRVVERGPATALLTRPAHPYTAALVASVPAVRTRTAIADPLPGAPASPADRPSGCPFRTRCARAFDRCASERPELREVAPGRWSACHIAEEVLG